MVILLFKCGCRYERVSKKLLRECPEHGEPLTNKIYYCHDCGKELITGITINKNEVCDACRRERWKVNTERNNKLKKLKEAKPEYGNKTPNRKIDCKFYSACLMPEGQLIRNPRACILCEDYIKKDFDETVEEIYKMEIV